MAKYHINKNGVPAICRAKKKPCPLGGEDTHFNTMNEAEEFVQNKMESNYGLISTQGGNNLINLEKDFNTQKKLVLSGNFESVEKETAARTELARLAKAKEGGSQSVRNLSELLNEIHSPDSGATFSIRGNNTAVVPVNGFCASPYPEHSKVFDNSKDVNAVAIFDYLDEIDGKDDSIFEDDETYLGLWNDPETGKVYLDISKRYDTAEDANKACEDNDQIAYFDLQVFQSVDVDREATSGQAG